jgi:flagellar basal-body rod protein FlgF
MDSGLYIAAAGMLAEQVRQGQLANDLANASTPGYKIQRSAQQSFGAMLLANTATGQTIGSIETGVTAGPAVTDPTPAALQSTGKPLDFGIQGTGFFAVRTPQGVSYTRDGQFTSNAQGQLTDPNGNTVLSQSGAAITVSSKGTVPTSALGVFNLTNVGEQGNNLLTGTVAGKGAGVVRNGQLEESGVNAIQTTTDMIASLRAYQSGQQAIQTIDQSMQSSAASVGSMGG